ncbi:MAG: BREX system ATP-binding domain-containing protein, partial [Candidatus Binatales bacterium]
MAVQSTQWLKLVEAEYLRRYTPSGGSSIKFIVGDPAVSSDLRDRLSSYARDNGFLSVAIDGAAVRLHMVQEVFFAVARAVDWERLAQERLEAAFKELRYTWPKPGSRVPLSEMSAANGVAETLLLNNVDQWLSKRVMHDAAMTSDFREAMTYLCRQRLEPEVSVASLPILEWLRGELRAIGAVRPVPIGAKITRHKARSMLRSLCHWLALGGHPGIVMTMDLSWLAERAASPAGIRYTPSSILDAFEVLRQLIDETDRLEGVFLVVTAPPALVDGDDVRRTIGQYPALKGRVSIDVQARQHDNPLAPLVRLV